MGVPEELINEPLPHRFQKRILGTGAPRAPDPSCTQDRNHHRRPSVPSEQGLGTGRLRGMTRDLAGTEPTAPFLLLQDGVILGADTRATNDDVVADKNCEKIHFIAPKI